MRYLEVYLNDNVDEQQAEDLKTLIEKTYQVDVSRISSVYIDEEEMIKELNSIKNKQYV